MSVRVPQSCADVPQLWGNSRLESHTLVPYSSDKQHWNVGSKDKKSFTITTSTIIDNCYSYIKKFQQRFAARPGSIPTVTIQPSIASIEMPFLNELLTVKQYAKSNLGIGHIIGERVFHWENLVWHPPVDNSSGVVTPVLANELSLLRTAQQNPTAFSGPETSLPQIFSFPRASGPKLLHGSWATRVYAPDCIMLGSAVFAQFTVVPNTTLYTHREITLRAISAAMRP